MTGEERPDAIAGALWLLGGGPGRALPASFDAGVTVLPPGETRPCDPERWRGALVVVRRGTVEVVTTTGERRRFAAGDLLVLALPGVALLVNPGPEPAELVALRRRGR